MPFAKSGKVSMDPIPGGVQITLQEYHDAIDAILAGKVIIVSGNTMMLADPPSTSQPDAEFSLDDVRQAALIRVDAEAEAARLRYMTAGAGQALTYQKKALEAKDCLAATDPQANAYPLLAAEVGITADTLVGVAQVVAENDALWVMIGAEIERLRLTAKAAIREAQSVAAIEAATVITWP